MADKIEKKIAELVSKKGGRVFYVGGYVRDKLLGIENKDVDIEVHGITPENLLSLLKEVGEPISYGTSFGIYSLRRNRQRKCTYSNAFIRNKIWQKV